MTRTASAIGCLLLALAPALRADLSQAKAEPNLEKRSKLALENAEAALKDARSAYHSGDLKKTGLLLKEVQDSVVLAETSLDDTGKNPRKSPKWFKRAELDTRDLLRRLTAFEQDMSVADRPLIQPVKTKIQQVHDDLLMGIMEGKKK